MTRILLLSPRIVGVGGIAQHVRQLAKRLRSCGYEVHLISSETLGLSLRKGLMNPGYALASSAHLLGRGYDVVHGHNLPSAPALKLTDARLKILTLHGIYSRQIGLLYGDALGSIARAVESILLREVDVVTAVTVEAARYYERLGVDVRYIPNAIDLSEMPRDGVRISDPQIIYLGRLSREKGVDLLVEAAMLGLRGVVVAGDGPLRPLIERASRDGLIRYLGPLPRWRALRLLAGSDVAVLPSREEGVSTALLEAMALKIPVVATRVGGNLEVVRDGVDGILVRPDASELVDAVERLLMDRDYAGRLSRNAFRRVLENYSWDKVFMEYLKLYRSVSDRDS